MEHHSRNNPPSCENPSVDFTILQSSPAFRHLQKQIQKMRKHFIEEGYTPKEVFDILHDILLRQSNHNIDWRNLNNTSDYYSIMEKFNSSQQVTESVLKFKQEINQMKASCQVQQQESNEQKESKSKGTQLDVNEISDRFLYRLDHSCKIDHGSSSSSSESGDSDNYSYHLHENIVQQEQNIEQKQQQVQQQKDAEQLQPYANSNKSNQHAHGQGATTNQNQNGASLNDTFSKEISNHEIKKKKKRKQHFQGEFQSGTSSLISEEDNLVLGDKKFKKMRRERIAEEPMVSRHNYAGKKRVYYFNLYNQPGNDPQEGLTNLAELEEIKMLEQKFRYFSQNEIAEEDNFPTNQN